jgi:hypothetical protein
MLSLPCNILHGSVDGRRTADASDALEDQTAVIPRTAVAEEIT